MIKLSVGDKAPEFSLRATDKSEKSLKDYSGQHVLLLFFPLAFTGVCTKELCGVRDDIGMYESLKAQVLAVSVDSLFTLEQFKAAQDYIKYAEILEDAGQIPNFDSIKKALES